jgi:outer membrane cobalamin receptor
MRSPFPFVIAVSIALAACHPSASGGGGESLRNVITQEQIDSSTAANVYDLIVRTNPGFLRDRGRTSVKTNQHERAVVFLNGQEYGIVETLRNMPINRLSEIRFFTGTEAVSRFGSQYGGGVIQLISRNQ